MDRERVTTLRNYLRDTVVDDRFSLTTWVGSDNVPWQGKSDLSCGTSACAMGWAATIPSFQALGLSLMAMPGNRQYGQIVYKNTVHFQAAAKFMDLGAEDALHFFSSESYPDGDETTRLQVVARISELLDSGNESFYLPSEWNQMGDAIGY